MMIPKPTRLTKIVRKITSSGRDMRRSLLDHSHTLDDHRVDRHVVVRTSAARGDGGDAVADVHSAEHATKDRVAEIFRREAAVIELGAVICHVYEELRGRAA